MSFIKAMTLSELALLEIIVAELSTDWDVDIVGSHCLACVFAIGETTWARAVWMAALISFMKSSLLT